MSVHHVHQQDLHTSKVKMHSSGRQTGQDRSPESPALTPRGRQRGDGLLVVHAAERETQH